MYHPVLQILFVRGDQIPMPSGVRQNVFRCVKWQMSTKYSYSYYILAGLDFETYLTNIQLNVFIFISIQHWISLLGYLLYSNRLKLNTHLLNYYVLLCMIQWLCIYFMPIIFPFTICTMISCKLMTCIGHHPVAENLTFCWKCVFLSKPMGF